MESGFPSFILSDVWWIEENKAWFVGGICDRLFLFQMDLNNRQCDFLAEVPNGNLRCIKADNNIFCMPNSGSNSIWVYQLEHLQFQHIEIVNPNKENLIIENFWIYNGKIYAVSRGLRQIIEVNANKKKIENYYNLCCTSNMEISTSIKVGSSIYSVSALLNEVFQFNIETKEMITHIISGIPDRLYTICFDGEKFWLSGYRREVYVWNKDNNTVRVISNFPKEFGIYNFKGEGSGLLDCEATTYEVPVFYELVFAGKYVWFIPYQTNKILYIDKDTYEIYTLEVEEEEESKYSLLNNHSQYKYELVYVLEERYIGIYSLKNRCILEIDAHERKVIKQLYTYSESCIRKLTQMHDKYRMPFLEESSIDRKIYERIIHNINCGTESENKKRENVGLDIIQKMTSL